MEVKNRAEKECLPLPILITFKDQREKKKLTGLLNRDTITDEVIDQILYSVANSNYVRTFKKDMFFMIEKQKEQLLDFRNLRETLELLLNATMEDL